MWKLNKIFKYFFIILIQNKIQFVIIIFKWNKNDLDIIKDTEKFIYYLNLIVLLIKVPLTTTLQPLHCVPTDPTWTSAGMLMAVWWTGWAGRLTAGRDRLKYRGIVFMIDTLCLTKYFAVYRSLSVCLYFLQLDFKINRSELNFKVVIHSPQSNFVCSCSKK